MIADKDQKDKRHPIFKGYTVKFTKEFGWGYDDFD
jgi:hypothetical protein